MYVKDNEFVPETEDSIAAAQTRDVTTEGHTEERYVYIKSLLSAIA